MESEKPVSAQRIFLPYVFDIVAPFLAYWIVQRFGGHAFWGLTAGGLAVGVSTAVNTVRRKGLDAVGMLVILEIAASIVLLLVVHDPRLMLVRPSFYTGLAAIYLGFTALVGRPLSFAGAKPMAAKGGPARLAAYERAWERSSQFRRAHRMVTLGFGVALLADSILRVVIVYRFPLDRSMWLSNLPHVAAMVLIMAASAFAGRTFKRLVDEQMNEPQP